MHTSTTVACDKCPVVKYDRFYDFSTIDQSMPVRTCAVQLYGLTEFVVLVIGNEK